MQRANNTIMRIVFLALVAFASVTAAQQVSFRGLLWGI